jgi:hypothetical protein
MNDLTAFKEHLVREIDRMLEEFDSWSFESEPVRVVNRGEALPGPHLIGYFGGHDRLVRVFDTVAVNTISEP